MGEMRRRIMANRLTADAFRSFGWIPVADTDPADATFRYEFARDDAHVNVISHGPDEVEHTDDALICDRFFRHDTHTQTLLALNVAAVVVVAPSTSEFDTIADLDSVRAFVLEPLEGFALARGTWHWGPFPLADEAVRLWNLQGKGYLADNRCIELRSALDTTFAVSR